MYAKPSAPFQPSNRGMVSAALETRKSLSIIAPQSPRPAEMLAGVSFTSGAADLTSTDLALHDLLITKAYESDRSMEATSYEIPMAECLKFLWADARKEDVNASLRRMETVRLSFSGETGRSFRDVQMLTSWTAIAGDSVAVGYQFPDPIRQLMRSMPKYGYVELAAIGQGSMRSKYSQMLYKRLAHEVSHRPWQEGSANTFTLEFTPAELAEIVGFKAPVKGFFSKLQERVISKFPWDFLNVRKFEFSITYDGLAAPARGQGKTTSLIQFHVKVYPDSHHTVKSDTRPLQALGHKIGKPDVARYRINSVFWLSVVKKFHSLGLTHFSAHWAWQVALDEALEQSPLTPEYSTRRYRGTELLGAIDANGPEAAAWCFFAEESERGSDICNSVHVVKKLSNAERNRIKRLTKNKKKGRSKKKVQIVVSAGPETVAKTPVEPPKAHDELHPTFETCTHIDLEIDEAATLCDLDDVIYQHLASRCWNGGRRIQLRAYFTVPGQNVRQHYLFTVDPADEDELIYELRKIDKWIAEPITYTIVEKKAA
ncbi:RepB family plasmid replication initiator protein [Rhizobium sp. 42MFCr.1]|uniref:RepB family plasmid replication initiator protein n=1 Tax=Rhizobium sp. 42MFCr.1 TaxID=1048680 RepID=UPI000379EEA7|nr:RepB family plasmid replication initiator protein [Rhizobium sp. 42MFCr.1]